MDLSLTDWNNPECPDNIHNLGNVQKAAVVWLSVLVLSPWKTETDVPFYFIIHKSLSASLTLSYTTTAIINYHCHQWHNHHRHPPTSPLWWQRPSSYMDFLISRALMTKTILSLFLISRILMPMSILMFCLISGSSGATMTKTNSTHLCI